MVHDRPRVGSVVGLAKVRAATADLIPAGETPLLKTVEDIDNLLVVCLIVGYEYCFHYLASFFCCLLSCLVANTQ